MEDAITVCVRFQDDYLIVQVYGNQPIHQVKDAWSIKKPSVNFQNYEIALHFRDQTRLIFDDQVVISSGLLREVEFIFLTPRGSHYHTPVNTSASVTQDLNVNLRN